MLLGKFNFILGAIKKSEGALKSYKKILALKP